MILLKDDIVVSSWSKEIPQTTEGCAIFLLEPADAPITGMFSQIKGPDIGDRRTCEYLNIKAYAYKQIGDFLVVVPIFVECDSPDLNVETGKFIAKWLKKKKNISLPARHANALVELAETSPDKILPADVTSMIEDWDSPDHMNDKVFDFTLSHAYLGRLIYVLNQGKMPNAHGDTLAQEGLQTLISAMEEL